MGYAIGVWLRRRFVEWREGASRQITLRITLRSVCPLASRNSQLWPAFGTAARLSRMEVSSKLSLLALALPSGLFVKHKLRCGAQCARR